MYLSLVCVYCINTWTNINNNNICLKQLCYSSIDYTALVRVKYTRWEDIDNEFYRKTFKKNNNNGTYYKQKVNSIKKKC